MILNLKDLNKHIKYSQFKMDNIDKVIQLLQPSDWMMSLDLNSAFCDLKVKDSDVCYFQFTWHGVFYCYMTLPQGFSDSPRLFTRCTSPIMSLMRQQLIDILIYIDDTFLRAPSFEEMSASLKLTRELFQNCSLSVNEEKSCITPSQCMEFLGFVLNTMEFSISVTTKKRSNLHQIIAQIVQFQNRKVKIRTIAKIVGKMVAMFPASDEAKMHYPTLERFKTKQVNLHKSWNYKVHLNGDCVKELQWWLRYLDHDIKKSSHKRKPTTTLFTDSSGFGFGGIWGSEHLQGRFTEKQKLLSINTKELLAIYYVLSMIGQITWRTHFVNV